MKKLKDKSFDRSVRKLAKEIFLKVGRSIPESEIADMIKSVRAMYQDVEIDIRPLCFMVVSEAKVSGRNLYDQVKVFAKEMSDLESGILADRKNINAQDTLQKK